MKKLLIVVPLLLSVSLFGQLRVSIDLPGTSKAEFTGGSDEGDIKMGLTLGYDYGIGSSGAIDYGAGGEYQLNREDDSDDPGKLGFTSVYGFGKYNISPAMYAVSRVGYAVMLSTSNMGEIDPDGSGGVMWSIGFGYPFNEQMSFEGGYASNAGTLDYGNGHKADITYARGYFTFNYSF